jgi:predicted AAA+ superfamily ATPase
MASAAASERPFQVLHVVDYPPIRSASRTGTLLNVSDVGQLTGVRGHTVSEWLALLERNALVVRLTPYHSNLNKRLVRTPKLYVLDRTLKRDRDQLIPETFATSAETTLASGLSQFSSRFKSSASWLCRL